MRKPIQIAMTSPEIGESWVDTIVALCDDGTIWTYQHGSEPSVWLQLPSVPQPAEPRPSHLDSLSSANTIPAVMATASPTLPAIAHPEHG